MVTFRQDIATACMNAEDRGVDAEYIIESLQEAIKVVRSLELLDAMYGPPDKTFKENLETLKQEALAECRCKVLGYKCPKCYNESCLCGGVGCNSCAPQGSY